MVQYLDLYLMCSRKCNYNVHIVTPSNHDHTNIELCNYAKIEEMILFIQLRIFIDTWYKALMKLQFLLLCSWVYRRIILGKMKYCCSRLLLTCTLNHQDCIHCSYIVIVRWFCVGVLLQNSFINWGRVKIHSILQTTFVNVFSWKKNVYLIEIYSLWSSWQ